MVKLLPGTIVPTGWALCEGQHLPIEQHPALFAILKSTYGGDGRHTFALPDLRADMAAMAALDSNRPAGAEPMGRLCAIKVANAPALPMAAAELKLAHQRRRLMA
jgi:microcystin-dependent protein